MCATPAEDNDDEASSGQDTTFTPRESDNEEESEDEITEEQLAKEQAQVGGKKTSKATLKSKVLYDHNNDNKPEEAFILPDSDLAEEDRASLPDFDDRKSDFSTDLDLSMLPDTNSDDEPAPLKRVPQRSQRNAKYEAERPVISSTSTKTKTKTRTQFVEASSFSTQANKDPNIGWPAITHLIYPNGVKNQRTLSLREQQPSIQKVLHESMPLAIGLAMFKHGFAEAAQQLSDSTTSILLAARTHQFVDIADRMEKDSTFAKHMTNYVTGRVGDMRGKVKKAAVEIVPSLYGILQVPVKDNQRKIFIEGLLNKSNYIFPRSNLLDISSTHRNEPYRHPAIIAVLYEYFFEGSRSLGKRYHDTFTSTTETDDAKEIPQPLLGLVVVGIFAALKEWENGLETRQKQDYDSAKFVEEYNIHVTMLQDKIIKPNDTGRKKYHTLMARLYREGSSGTSAPNQTKAAQDKLPDFDFDGME